MNTHFEYLYRDAANYKRFGTVILAGELSASDRATIQSKLEMGELFVAEQVGLPSIRSEWLSKGLASSRDDNGWHWLVSMSPYSGDGPTLMPASELVRRFRAVDCWRFDLVDDLW